MVIWLRKDSSPGVIPSSMSYCRPGIRPKTIMRASSTSSSTRRRTRCQGALFTLTARPLDRVFATTRVRCEASLSSSSKIVRPRDASDGSVELKVEDKINVAETDVISLTDSAKRSDQGLIECQSESIFQRPKR